ncbi:MAG TPA: GxxExxY protein [Vicinamibacterales bacterium]|nr:GxxExxY protein [Vicinamibacterales bacterium]
MSDSQTYEIIGAAMEVHRILPRGLFEKIYCEALGIELALRHIPFEPQYPMRMKYKGQRLAGFHYLDFVCFTNIVVEVKAASALTPADEAQLLNYLAMTGIRRGLLINFGAKSLQFERRVLG